MLKKILFTILSILPISATAQTDKQCLASAIYYEANIESVVGQRAVMDVILNRAKFYKKSVCAIIKQPGQFSFVKSGTIWLDDRRSSKILTTLSAQAIVSRCILFFHRRDVQPRWAKKKKFIKLIGNHMFYSENRCVNN